MKNGRARKPAPPTAKLTDAPKRPTLSFGRRLHALAASALLLVYLAGMSGHLASVDGLLMARQAHAIVFDHSVQLKTQLWNWEGVLQKNSQYGIGLSLLYVPGMILASPAASLLPVSKERPANPDAYYFRQLYEDPLYTIGASWVHAVIVALAAFLVGRLITALGFTLRASLWGMAFYGLGSSSLVYAKGDFSQPLVGLCMTAALLAAVRYRDSGASSALWCCATAVGYAILTRPFEGLLLAPAVLFVLLPAKLSEWRLPALRPALPIAVGAFVGAAATLAVNWARFDDPLKFGYSSGFGWSVPEAAQALGVLVSPGRGILWEFPAVVLLPLGVVALVRRGHRREVRSLLFLCGALLASAACWHVWWGGWCWGLRLFLPASALIAVMAGAAVDRLGPGARRWLPGLLLLAGFVWAVPGALTDLIGGYAKMADGTAGAWRLDAYPPYGAWQYLQRVFVDQPLANDGIDILWFRLARVTGNWSLVVPAFLLAGAAALGVRCSREVVVEEGEGRSHGVSPAE